MNDAERNFQNSLNSFNMSSNVSGSGSGSGGFGSSVSNFFSRGAGGAASGGTTTSTGSDGPLASLMGTVRSTTQNVASSLGLAPPATPQEDEYCGLTYFQRVVGFVLTFGLAAFCFMVSFISLPLVLISPTKFATTFSLGSLLASSSFALIRGPRSYLKDLMLRERLPWTAAYFGSLLLTLYFSLVAHTYIFTILSSIVQLIALCWFFASYVPGGTAGLSFFTSMFSSSRPVSLPV